jgi:hypothetical protein
MAKGILREKHRQVSVNGIKVDAGLASLLRTIWKLGIKTCASCESQGQSTEALVWLQFPNPCEAMKFFGFVAPHLKEIVWTNNFCWEMNTPPEDFEKYPNGCTSVRFQTAELPLVRKIFRRWTKQ